MQQDIMDMNLNEISAFITGMHKFVCTEGSKEMIESMGKFLDNVIYLTSKNTIDSLVIEEYKKKKLATLTTQ